MRRPMLTTALCVTAAGGFDISFSRPTYLRAQRSPGLNTSPVTSSSYLSSRCSRRRTRTTTRMAGPNKGQNPKFFSDWPVLEAELRAYLVERQSGEPEESNNGQPPKRSAILSYLSVDPTKMVPQYWEQDDWEGEADKLSYSELTRFGYDYLIEPMINAGGFSTVSERMGIGMNVRTLKNEIEHERIDPLATFKVPETDGYLTLGRARDERLEAVSVFNREEKSKALFEKQAMMDTEKNPEAKASQSTPPKRRKVMLGGRTEGGLDEEMTRAPGLPKGEGTRPQWTPPKEERVRPPAQPLLLSLPQRANTVIVVACCALAFGRGTAGAMQAGVLPEGVAEVAVPASLLLLGLNFGSAAVSGFIAKSKGRSMPLWVFKGALAGLTSVLELKELPDITANAEVASTAEGSSA